MKFSSLLKEYRERRDLNKSKLASKIGKTDAYIRKLEQYDYTPPRFEVCNDLAQVLELSEAEKNVFFRVAFFGRAKQDSSFFSYIQEKGSVEESVSNFDENNVSHKENDCSYVIRWTTIKNKSVFDSDDQRLLQENVTRSVKNFGYTCHKCHASESQLVLHLDLPAEIAIKMVSDGLKNMSAESLRSQRIEKKFPSQIWASDTEIFTVSTFKNEPVLIEKTFSLERHAETRQDRSVFI